MQVVGEPVAIETCLVETKFAEPRPMFGIIPYEQSHSWFLFIHKRGGEQEGHSLGSYQHSAAHIFKAVWKMSESLSRDILMEN